MAARSKQTHFSAKPYWGGAATELIANDTRYRNSTTPPHSRRHHALQAHCSGPPAGPRHCSSRSPPTPAIHPDAHSPHCCRKAGARRPEPEWRLHQPTPEKRGNRDPYGDWWDKQERRNYGEPCHEDNDILGVLSLHDYNHFTPGWGAVLLGISVATVFGLCAAVSTIYPDKISVPKTYPGGLDLELGGKGAVPARKSGESW
ncbi:hypothetical protein P3342_013255 [Pyrenophora teres f. teres]|nr:hypothetical protein P3342_013255 [Pyrenophora teres f. teres]